MDLPSYSVTTASAPKINLNSISLKHLHEIDTKVGLQPLLTLDQNPNYILYHTTIPLYVVLISIGAIAAALLYRKYFYKRILHSGDNPEENQMELQAVYTIPTPTRRVDLNQPPAQFTTKVPHIR
ncbi:unnamed protein product [Danaus chrysippus]|uniref:(African queen) hypothetical protein n=1 Tax=Danaus chrysippus TaxID=151541 RepID=A0A8J2QT25_9NEOP|nr:unnamed protein product [Danaus chrysippus]